MHMQKESPGLLRGEGDQGGLPGGGGLFQER